MAESGKAKDIKVGVIGYGGAFSMAGIHLNEMKRAGMTPRAVAEIDSARLAVARKDFPGIETYDCAAAMLKKSDVNLVTLVTPHNTHAALAVQCLKAGRHVVCEKPFAITTAECDRMIAAAQKNDLLLSTYHNRHWDGCILQALKTIKKGAIGEVVRVEAHMGSFGRPGDWWRSSKSISGGILYDWGVHLLEYTLQIVDSEIVEVTGLAKTDVWATQTAWKQDTNEDEGFLLIRYANGVWSSLCISQIDCHPKHGWLEITGTKGSYIFDGESWELFTRDRKGSEVTIRGKNQASQWDRYYRNIADHLTKNTPLIITPQWARRPIHILDLADQSVKKGRSLRAKYS